MPDARPQPLPARTGIVKPGRFGRADGAPGVTVREVTGAGLANVAARKHQCDALAAAIRTSFGVDLPSTPRRVDGATLSMVWSGPEQWLAIAEQEPAQGMEALLTPIFGLHASVADQSHGRVIVRLSGPRVRDALAKGLAIDLHPRAFRPGDTAVTQVAHIGVQIWQLDSAPTYEMVAFRGFAGSLWRWLELSAAEYGLEFLT